jgi:hypothetical protein
MNCSINFTSLGYKNFPAAKTWTSNIIIIYLITYSDKYTSTKFSVQEKQQLKTQSKNFIIQNGQLYKKDKKNPKQLTILRRLNKWALCNRKGGNYLTNLFKIDIFNRQMIAYKHNKNKPHAMFLYIVVNHLAAAVSNFGGY